MRTMSLLSLLSLSACAMNAGPATQAAIAPAASLIYPETERQPIVETQFGARVADPYRWLEGDVRQSPKVQAWVAAQNAVTDSYLATLPSRKLFAERIRAHYDFERFGIPVKAGARYFYTRNPGLQNQAALYVREGLEGAPRLLIDPNGWSKDGATALAEWEPSDDGSRLLYSVQEGGTDWRVVRVIDTATGKLLADEVKWVKFSNLDWLPDGSGFFYSRFPEPGQGEEFQSLNENQGVYIHKLGTPQAQDALVFAQPDRPRLGNVAQVSDDGRWLVVTSSEGTDERYEINVIDLKAARPEPRRLVSGLENNWTFLGNSGSTFYWLTDKEAPRRRIVAMATGHAEPRLREIVPQAEATLDSASLVGRRLVASYLKDARTEVRTFDLDGTPGPAIALPGIGTATGFEGKAGDPETFFAFTSFNRPAAIFRYNSATGETATFAEPKVAFAPDDYTVSQRFYRSKDGTRVPMFLVHRRDLDMGKPHPTLLYGYGGFNVSLTPGFSATRLAWMEQGGVFAVANIRGGGEYGKAWHEAGRLAAKQNVFDDFIAAAEFLIAEGITSKRQLAIQGGSNGGLLVGAVVNQRPDLFAAALPAVGVMDMLRFNLWTAGRYWVDDYGYPDRETDFRTLLAYSPYHNIRAGADYPAVLVTTADTDDRVVPGHSFKYVAALQAARAGSKPHLIRIETRAGHGSGKPTEKIIEEYADLWAFAAAHTGLAR
jgi:prolyl oligopeptidase